MIGETGQRAQAYQALQAQEETRILAGIGAGAGERDQPEGSGAGHRAGAAQAGHSRGPISRSMMIRLAAAETRPPGDRLR